MPRTVIIVRHAEPEILPDQSPASWPLSPAGRIAATALGRQIPDTALLASSGEIKAVETVCLAAAAEPSRIRIDDRFGEVHRPGEPFDGDHRARRRAWVEGRTDARHESWETPDQAAHRFQEGLGGVEADVVVVATHGMVLTSWLVQLGRVRPGVAAGDFWADLAFPDVLRVRL